MVKFAYIEELVKKGLKKLWGENFTQVMGKFGHGHGKILLRLGKILLTNYTYTIYH